jgi:hypothetical protein
LDDGLALGTADPLRDDRRKGKDKSRSKGKSKSRFFAPLRMTKQKAKAKAGASTPSLHSGFSECQFFGGSVCGGSRGLGHEKCPPVGEPAGWFFLVDSSMANAEGNRAIFFRKFVLILKVVRGFFGEGA